MPPRWDCVSQWPSEAIVVQPATLRKIPAVLQALPFHVLIPGCPGLSIPVTNSNLSSLDEQKEPFLVVSLPLKSTRANERAECLAPPPPRFTVVCQVIPKYPNYLLHTYVVLSGNCLFIPVSSSISLCIYNIYCRYTVWRTSIIIINLVKGAFVFFLISFSVSSRSRSCPAQQAASGLFGGSRGSKGSP